MNVFLIMTRFPRVTERRDCQQVVDRKSKGSNNKVLPNHLFQVSINNFTGRTRIIYLLDINIKFTVHIIGQKEHLRTTAQSGQPKNPDLSESGISTLISQELFFSFAGIDYHERTFDSMFGALKGRNSQKWGNKNLEGHEKVDVSPAG